MSSIRLNKFNAAAKLMEPTSSVKSVTTTWSLTDLSPKKKSRKK